MLCGPNEIELYDILTSLNIYSGDFARATYLIVGLNVNVGAAEARGGTGGPSFVINSIQNGCSLDFIRALVERGANPRLHDDTALYATLSLFIKRDYGLAIAKYLIEECQADINARNGEMFHLLASASDEKIEELLPLLRMGGNSTLISIALSEELKICTKIRVIRKMLSDSKYAAHLADNDNQVYATVYANDQFEVAALLSTYPACIEYFAHHWMERQRFGGVPDESRIRRINPGQRADAQPVVAVMDYDCMDRASTAAGARMSFGDEEIPASEPTMTEVYAQMQREAIPDTVEDLRYDPPSSTTAVGSDSETDTDQYSGAGARLRW